MAAPRTMWRLCLLACFLMVHAARSSSPAQAAAVAMKGQAPPGSGPLRALSAPIIGHDGRLIACSGKKLLAFEPNGSVAWTVRLGHRCNHGIPPVTERGKVYLVAEDKIIQVTPHSKNSSAVFFSYNATAGRSEEIIGFSISEAYSSLFVTIRNRGLFVFSLRGGLQWSLGPMLSRFGYRQGCKENISACYFDSAPVVDPCEGSLYISNTEGQLYSLLFHSRHFIWIQDLSSLDKVMTIAKGNSGRLYVLFPRKSIVVGLDSSTGNISWQRNIGPLLIEENSPTVDLNGWMSIGSLDGNLYSISPDGDIKKLLQKAANDSVIYASPVLDCSGFFMYVAQTIVEAKSSKKIGDHTYVSALKKTPQRVLLTLLAPITGTIYWTAEYPGELSSLLSRSELNDFIVDETILLTFLSASRIGNTTQCYTRRQKINLICRKIVAELPETNQGGYDHLIGQMIVQSVVIVIQVIVVRLCCVLWRKKNLQRHGLDKFLEKRNSLHKKRRVLGRMISQLEQKTAEDTSSNETLLQLGEIVKAKEGVEEKLYSSYSLGRDRLGLRKRSSVLPQYGNYISHSFQEAQEENLTIYKFNDISTSGDGTSSASDGTSGIGTTSSGEMEFDATSSKPAEEPGPSNTADVMFVEG